MRCVLARSAPAALVLAALLPGCFAWPWDDVVAQRDGGVSDAGARDAGGSDGGPFDAARDGGSRLPDRLLVFSRLSIVAPTGGVAVGLDLDGVVSEGLTGECDDRPDAVSPSGAAGVDNAFASALDAVEPLLGASIAEVFAQRIEAGASLAIELSSLDDEVDDDEVGVRAFLAFHADPGAPRLDDGSLAPLQTFALQPIGDPGAGRIEDGELVAQLGELPIPLLPDAHGARVVRLRDVTLRGALSGASLTDAVLGGALPLTEAPASISPALAAHADLASDGAACRSISVGASVDAVAARALRPGALPLVWVPDSAPALGCVGVRGNPPTGGPGEATVRVNERRGGSVPDGNIVQIFHGQPLATCDPCVEERASGGSIAFEAVDGAWFSWRVVASATPTGADPLATVGYFGRVVVGTARDNAIEYVSHATAQALASEHGRSRVSSSAMIVGAVRDCAGAPLGGVEVRAFVDGDRVIDGMSTGLGNASFIGYRDELGAVSRRPFSSAGDYVLGNLPRAWAPMRLEAWATLEEGAPPVRIACEELEPFAADDAVLIDLGPTRAPESYPVDSPCR